MTATPRSIPLLDAARDHLQPAEARVADALISGLPGSLELPVAEIAKRAGTSQASVIRLAQTLGYRGFRELRIELIRLGEQTGKTVFEEISSDDTPDVVAGKVAAAATTAIDETRQLLNTGLLPEIVARLAAASRIESYGIGASGIVAIDASTKLRRVGLPAWSYPDAHQQAQSAALLSADCVVFAFSHSGATNDVVRAAELARQSQALVVAVTSFPLSPLARVSDYVLLTGAASEPTDRSGSTTARLAQIYVVDVLTVCYSLAYPKQSSDALSRTGKAVEDRRTRNAASWTPQ